MPRRSLAVAAGVVATGALGTALVLAKRRDHRRDVLDLSYLLLPNVRAHATSCIFGSNGTVIVVYSPRSTDSKVEVRVHTELENTRTKGALRQVGENLKEGQVLYPLTLAASAWLTRACVVLTVGKATYRMWSLNKAHWRASRPACEDGGGGDKRR